MSLEVPTAFGINLLDIAVVLFVVISAILGIFRGLTREVLSIIGWVGAILVTIYGFYPLREYTRQFIPYPIFADLLTGILLFIVTLSVLTFLSKEISLHVRGSILGSLDRSLGLLFGVFRGAFLICLLYLLLSFVVPSKEKYPPIILTARLLPWVQEGAGIIKDMIPEEFLEKTLQHKKSLEEEIPPMEEMEQKMEKTVERLSTLTPVIPQGRNLQNDKNELKRENKN